MDIISPETQRLIALPEVKAAIRRLLDGVGHEESVTLSNGRTVIVRKVER